MSHTPRELAILSGRLRDRRESVKESLVENVITRMDFEDRVSVSDVKRKLTEIGISMDQSDIRKRMHELSENDELRHSSGDLFIVATPKEDVSFDSRIDELWAEFKPILSEEYNNIDHINLDSDMRSVFEEFVNEIYDSLFSSTEELIESEIDPLVYLDLEDNLNEIIDQHDIHKKGIYRETVLEYFKNPSDKLTEVIQLFYTATINYHILQSGKEIDFDSIPAGGKVLFYDTNVVVNMLCRTKDLYPIVNAVTDLSNKLGFEQYYIRKNARELDQLIRMSKREMSDIGQLPPNSGIVENELLEEFYFGDEFSSLEEFHSFLGDWRTLVSVHNHLEEYDGEYQRDESVFEWSKAAIREFDKASGELDISEKGQDNINLDAEMLAIIASMRQDIDSDLEIGPNVISRDNGVIRTSNAGQPTFWDYNIAIHPRQWLNYLLAYTTVEFSEENWKEISKGLLNSAMSFEQDWTYETYAKVLSDKLDHSGDPKIIERFMIESPKNRDIKQGLKERDGNKVERAIAETAGNEAFCEAFQEAIEADEKRAKTIETLKRLRRRNEELEQQLAEERAESPNSNVTVDVDVQQDAQSAAQSVADSTAFSVSRQEVINDVSEMIEVLNNSVEGDLRDSDVPTPPDDPSKLESTKAWLEDFVEYVDTGSNVVQTAKILAPTARKLLPAVVALL